MKKRLGWTPWRWVRTHKLRVKRSKPISNKKLATNTSVRIVKRRRKSASPFQQRVGAGASENTDTQSVLFTFEKMVGGTGYSVGCCQDRDLAALLKKIFDLRSTVWRDLKQAPRHGIGTEKIDTAAINPPLPRALPEDAILLAMRFSGRKPVVGYREGRYFHLLYIDHNFSVYDH